MTRERRLLEQSREQVLNQAIELGRAVEIVLLAASGGIYHVLPGLELDDGEFERRKPDGERTVLRTEVSREPADRGRARCGVGVNAPDVLHVLVGHRQNESRTFKVSLDELMREVLRRRDPDRVERVTRVRKLIGWPSTASVPALRRVGISPAGGRLRWSRSAPAMTDLTAFPVQMTVMVFTAPASLETP